MRPRCSILTGGFDLDVYKRQDLDGDGFLGRNRHADRHGRHPADGLRLLLPAA